MKRPGRARMCSWLSSALHGIRTLPANPANIQLLSRYAKEADARIAALARIAAELGWHADADLDFAWALIRDYEEKFPG